MSIGLKNVWKHTKGSRLTYKFKRLKWELFYAWQRAWNGYDDMDSIAMYYTFIERYKVVLKDLRKYHQGLFSVPEEYKEVFNKDYFNEEETDVIIETMIYHLEMMDEDHVEKVLYDKNVYDNDYEIDKNMFQRYKRIFSIMNQNKEAFMELFNLFFWDLWC